MTTPLVRSDLRPLSGGERFKLAIHRWLDKHLSPFGVWIMRRSKGRVTDAWKVDALVLTTNGRRSGRERRVVLQYFPDGDAMIVAAANDGGQSHPGWYFNLTASPDAMVELDGQQMPVHAVELPRDEAAYWWQRIIASAPSYALYRRATARPFPIVRLTRADVVRAVA